MDDEWLLALWSLVERGEADPQQRVNAVTLSGKLERRDHAPRIWRLVDDENSEVRLYVLLTTVLDLGVRSAEVSERCRRAAVHDENEDVRSTAVVCLGHIFFGACDVEVFGEIRAILQNDVSALVRSSAYTSLFKLAGKPPSEWPGFRVAWRSLRDVQIDWATVAMLENEVRAHSSPPLKLPRAV